MTEKEIFLFAESHSHTELELPNKNFFINNYILNVFLFVTTINPLLATVLVLNILCKNRKLKTLVASLALQQIKEVSVVAMQETWRHITKLKLTKTV